MIEPRLPKLACELQGGHCWSDPLPAEDVLGNKSLIVICLYCQTPRREVPLAKAA